ncbi:hypothetical protein V866_007018 [Kwoniella sp. B9012]|uniref:Uncharacterized protein n=1 Tax=Kwoniella europaea PYCC6329 TaxID=1423913 RepID=A0AAX4KRF1_9TREE
MINQRYTYSTSIPSTAPPTANHSLSRPQRPDLRIITSLSDKHTLHRPNPLPRLYDPTNLNGSIAAATAPLPLLSQNPYLQPVRMTHTHGDSDTVHDTSQFRKMRNMRNREVYVYEEDRRGSFLDEEGDSSGFVGKSYGCLIGDQIRNRSLPSTINKSPVIHSRLDALPPNRVLGHKRKLSDKFKNLIGKARRKEHSMLDLGGDMSEYVVGKPMETENVKHSIVHYGHPPTIHVASQSCRPFHQEAAYRPPVVITYPTLGVGVDTIPMASDHSEVAAAQEQDGQESDDEMDKNSFSENDKEESEESWGCV